MIVDRPGKMYGRDGKANRKFHGPLFFLTVLYPESRRIVPSSEL